MEAVWKPVKAHGFPSEFGARDAKPMETAFDSLHVYTFIYYGTIYIDMNLLRVQGPLDFSRNLVVYPG